MQLVTQTDNSDELTKDAKRLQRLRIMAQCNGYCMLQCDLNEMIQAGIQSPLKSQKYILCFCLRGSAMEREGKGFGELLEGQMGVQGNPLGKCLSSGTDYTDCSIL